MKGQTNKRTMKQRQHYENIAKTIMSEIFPYLIIDLKNYYKKDFTQKTIVEIGTGPGFIIKELLKEDFKKVIGIEISLDMLLRVKKRNINDRRLQLINAKAENIPLKDESIDLIISRGSVFFWEDLNSALNEIYRILKKDGFLLIGGGYGISTPDNIVEEIIKNYREINKNSKPKLDIDYIIEIMNNIGGKTEVIAKPKHGFWIIWNK